MTFKLVRVYDWYCPSHSTRVRCLDVKGTLYVSPRQVRDAKRRVGLISGSVLRADSDQDILVSDNVPFGYRNVICRG